MGGNDYETLCRVRIPPFFTGGRSFYTQAVDDALAEIDRLPGKHLYFLDDHLFGNRRFATALFDGMRGMVGWKKFEPAWDWIIQTKRISRMLPVLEGVLTGLGNVKKAKSERMKPLIAEPVSII